jgi:hypothetical protein
LDTRYLSEDPINIATLIAHEMKHILQYRAVAASMRRSVQPNCPRAMTCCFFASLKMLAMPAEGLTAPPPRQRLERLLPMAGFQLSIYGRFWVSTEDSDTEEARHCYRLNPKNLPPHGW